jgi:hypothetical protein
MSLRVKKLLAPFSYIIIELPTFTESGRFAILLAGNPCDNPAFHFHLKEDSEFHTPRKM